MNRIVKNYLYNVAYQIFLILVPIVTAPYLTRVLSDDSLGTYGYVNSVVSIIATIGLLGLNSYGYRQIAYVRGDQEKTNTVFSQILMLRVLLLAVISAVYLPIVSTLEYARFFYIQYFLIAAQFLDVSWIFIGFEDLGIVAFRNFVAKLLTVIGIFLFVKTDDDLWIYFALFAIITFITTITLYFRVNKYVRFHRKGLGRSFTHIWPSIKLFIPQIATTLYLQFDKVMLQSLSGNVAYVAYYDYAEKLINIPLAVITALSTVMMPRLANLFANNNKSQISSYLNKTIRFAMFVAIPLMFGLAAIAKRFVPWYLGDKYLPTAELLVILCPMCLITTLTNIFGTQYLTAINKTRELTIAYYSAAIIDILLNALLIPSFGYVGAAIATLVCTLVSLMYQIYVVSRDINIMTNVVPCVRYCVFGSLMFVMTYLIGNWMRANVWTTLWQVVIGFVIYMALVYISKDDMLIWAYQQIRSKVKNK